MPARLRDIQKAASAFGVVVTEPRSGSHWHCNKAGMRVYTLPAHNGLKSEIDDKYIRAFCRHFGIDEQAFRATL